MRQFYLAIDIGASSGRHIVGWKENGKIMTDEVYRFPNGVKEENGRLVWDISALFKYVKRGITEAFHKYPRIESLAIDTWAVDYVLMNGEKEILPCYSYRDRNTDSLIDRVHKAVSFEEMYVKTGIQFQPFNTVYRFYDELLCGRLQQATDFLMFPEYLTYKLTGVKLHEYTNATTTGLLNISGVYDEELIARLGFPKKLFQKIAQPGTYAGMLLPEIAREVGGTCKVLLCASHDTASAVEGIPMTDDNPYLSSGTWSLLGIKMPNALTDEKSRMANYSNEGGVGYIRYQKNIMGQWIVNRLRQELCPEKPFLQIEKEARVSTFRKTVDVNDTAFLSPVSMKDVFDDFLKEKQLHEGDYFNCAFLSLAESYRKAIEELEENTGKKFTKLYIVGGGAKNGYLNELTARICKIEVVALPIEATAIGNLTVQMEVKNDLL